MSREERKRFDALEELIRSGRLASPEPYFDHALQKDLDVFHAIDAGKEPSRTVVTILGPDGKNLNGDIVPHKRIHWERITDPKYQAKPIQFTNEYLGKAYAPPPEPAEVVKSFEEFVEVFGKTPPKPKPSMAETLRQIGQQRLQPARILMSKQQAEELLEWASHDALYDAMEQDLWEGGFSARLQRGLEDSGVRSRDKEEVYVFPDVSDL